uniref:DDE Tnp4 domain-containing protein n=1 Tax=Trichogramma kaykai TaxID=54128 RepID=A0ABD2WAH6_9HYME
MAIWSVLQLLDLPQPNMNILLESANNFHHIWNLPHCIGALDVCHMEIKRPHYSGTRYWSNKKYYSTTLQALVDARQRLGGLRLLENGRGTLGNAKQVAGSMGPVDEGPMDTSTDPKYQSVDREEARRAELPPHAALDRARLLQTP